MPKIGLLYSATTEQLHGAQLRSFHTALAEQGFAVGRNVAIEYRWDENRYEALPALASDLVQRRVAVIVAAGRNVSAQVAKAATSSIPIVFTAVTDPVGTGLVATLGRPGGNVTGVAILGNELDAKRLELLHEMVLQVAVIDGLVNQNNPNGDSQARLLEVAAGSPNRQAIVERAGSEAEIDRAIRALHAKGARALFVGADPFFTSRRTQGTALAARLGLPDVYQWCLFVEAGGLLSYGPDLFDAYRQAGGLVGRILKGEKPANLPVLQPTKFEIVLNLKAAKSLGIAVPQSFLLRAADTIE